MSIMMISVVMVLFSYTENKLNKIIDYSIYRILLENHIVI